MACYNSGPTTLTCSDVNGLYPGYFVGVFGPYDVSSILVDNWSVLVFTLVFQAIAVYVLWRRPREPAAVALIVAASGVSGSTLPWLLGLQVSDLVLGWPFLLHALTAGGIYRTSDRP